MNGLDDELVRELRAHSEDVGGHPIGMDSVRRTARRIVWRRRIVTGVAAAAVLAVAVPAGMAATGGVDHGIGPVGHPTPTVTHAAPTPPSSPGPAPSPTPPTGSPLPAGVVPLTTVGAPRGSAPNIPYMAGHVLHQGWRTFGLGRSYTEITNYHGGWIAHANDRGDTVLYRLYATPAGVPRTTPSSSGFAVDDSGLVAWFEAGGSGGPGHLVRGIATGMSDGQASVPVPPGVSAHPVGFVQGGRLVYTTDGTDPQVLLTDFNPGTSQVWLKGALNAGGASEAADAISVQTRTTDFGSCWAVVDPGWTEMDPAGHVRFHTCDYSLGTFSPSGKYVVGHEAYADGLGWSSVAILDASTGEPVARFQRPPGSDLYVNKVVWEDDTHLLAVVHENGAWQIVRLGVDGRVESATGPVPGSDTRPEFFLSARP